MKKSKFRQANEIEDNIGSLWHFYGLFHGTESNRTINALDKRIKNLYEKWRMVWDGRSDK